MGILGVMEFEATPPKEVAGPRPSLPPSNQESPVQQNPSQDAPAKNQGTRAAPARALTHGSLRTTFMDLIGRPPFEREYEEWLGQGRHKLLDALLGSDEYWGHWWSEQLYYFLLVDNFQPNAVATRAIPGKLAEGRLDYRTALHRIALTSSFDQRNPGSDTFVTVVMEQFCGLVVQKNRRDLESGKRAYDGGKGNFLGTIVKNQSEVIEVCVNHSRAAKHFLAREHERLVHSPGDKKELGDQARRLHRDPWKFLATTRDWLLSDAYKQRLGRLEPKSNALFLNTLFVDLLDRLPTEDELDPMRTALDALADPRPLRSVVVRLLLDSGRAGIPKKASITDPTQWISRKFRRLLGREATAAELKIFVSTFHQADCRPATIMYALLSHPEYQNY